MRKTGWSLIVVAGAVLLLVPFIGQTAEPSGTSLEIKPPLGLPPVPIPADNPMTKEKVELGKMLYFDKRLSKDGTLSCATCHTPTQAYAEDRSTSKGINDQIGGRNANSVINTAYMTSMFWDGRAKDLEEQAGGPVQNPIEMGEEMVNVVAKLSGIKEYEKRFKDVFGTGITQDGLQKAIAAFERTILSGNSAYDKFQNGDTNALSADAKAGLDLFKGKMMCAVCHTPPLFTNGAFFNTGAGEGKGADDVGRMEVTKDESDRGAFRVPSLRDAAKTGPYMHDGSIQSLRDAVKFMANGGKENPHRTPLMAAIPKPTDQEIDQLTAFLESLSGEYPIVEEPKLP